MNPETVAVLNVISALITELQEAGHVDAAKVIEKVQHSAAEHRKRGDEKRIADPLHRISEYLLKTVPLTKTD